MLPPLTGSVSAACVSNCMARRHRKPAAGMPIAKQIICQDLLPFRSLPAVLVHEAIVELLEALNGLVGLLLVLLVVRKWTSH